MSAMRGRCSVMSPNSTRPLRRGRSFRYTRPVSSVRNGAVPKCGSSATSSLCSSIDGSGNRPTDSDAHFTGRPTACAALLAIIAWTRGVSISLGNAIAAMIASTTRTPTMMPSHFKARFNAHPSRRLCGLDRRKPPGLRADRAREGPVFLDIHGRSGPLHDRTGRIVDGVVDERYAEVHRHPVLTALLPGLGHLGPADLDALDPVRPPRGAELIALRLQPAELLRREAVRHRAQVTAGNARLHVDEGLLRPAGEPGGIEGRVHAPDVADPTVEVRLARWGLHHGAARRPAALGRAVRSGAGVRRLGARLASAQHPEHEKDPASDQQ